MTWKSELVTWAVPGVTWMLALIAYVVLLVVEGQLELKRRLDSIRRRAGQLGQARHSDLAGVGSPRPQRDEPRPATQSRSAARSSSDPAGSMMSAP